MLESICFEMRRNLGELADGTGTPITQLRIMGGGARSGVWRQIMADVTGVPLTVCLEEEISALGAAVLAMAAINAHAEPLADGSPDVASSARAMASFGETVHPDMELLYPALRETFQELAALSQD